MKKIGIFGGTFDPVHSGHLFLAELAKRAYGLDEVIFMPANQPSHKQQPLATPQQRLELLEKVLEGKEGFCVSRMELSRGGVSYTVETLRELCRQQPADYYFLIGSDTLPELGGWVDIAEIFKLCTFICVRRPQAEEGVEEQIERYERDYGAKILSLNVMGKDISSTEVRTKAAEGQSIIGLVPGKIYQDVLGIYGPKES